LAQNLSHLTELKLFINKKSMSMRSIRRIALTALVAFTTFGTVTFTSCNPDECKDVVCNNGGTCNEADGSCTCASGYEGTACETAWATKFTGTYSVTENCSLSGSVGPYSATIAASSTNNVTILLSNFGNFTTPVTINATVASTNTLTIPQQTVGGKMFQGSGTYTNGILNITYSVSGTGTENCTAVWTKQ
jgi:hypothetical protein